MTINESLLGREKARSRELPSPQLPPPKRNLILDLPPELRTKILEYSLAAPSRTLIDERSHFIREKPYLVPGLLGVNRQIRGEALSIFYSTNNFHFQSCDAKFITRWLFHGVQPKHLKFIKSISWEAPSPKTTWTVPWGFGPPTHIDNVQVYSQNLQDQAIHLAAVIMLLELGLLGKCKVKMTLENEPRYHVACVLRELVRKQITRKSLTAVDAWNEKSVPGEDDVAGLSYAISKEWGRLLPGVFQQYWWPNPLAPEKCCPFCLPVYWPHQESQSGKPYLHPYIPWVKQDENTVSNDGQRWWRTTEEDD
jgi:hypothetical protein